QHPRRNASIRSLFARMTASGPARSEEHTSELQSLAYLVCRLLLEKKTKIAAPIATARVLNLTWHVVNSHTTSAHRWSLSSAASELAYTPCVSTVHFFFFKGPGPPGFSPSSPPRRSPD